MRNPLFAIIAGLTIVLANSAPSAAAEVGIRKAPAYSKAGGRAWKYSRRGCPDRYSCFPLYGAYGPWGGVAYWSAYTWEYRH